jgi:hypothetical protein
MNVTRLTQSKTNQSMMDSAKQSEDDINKLHQSELVGQNDLNHSVCKLSQVSDRRDDHHQSGADKEDCHQSSIDDQFTRLVAARSSIMGHMHQRVLVVIRWKKGHDQNVTASLVQEMEQWLCKRGPSIYIDPM